MSSAESDSKLSLHLISRTFLCELECTDGQNVGLAAGRYSGKSRPDLYRTPQALQSVFGPIGPALHCGVLVISQCMHFLTGSEPFCSPPSVGAVGSGALTFFFFLVSPEESFGFLTKIRDSAKFSKSEDSALVEKTLGCMFSSTEEEVGEMRFMAERGLKAVGRGRLVRARPQGTGMGT